MGKISKLGDNTLKSTLLLTKELYFKNVFTVTFLVINMTYVDTL